MWLCNISKPLQQNPFKMVLNLCIMGYAKSFIVPGVNSNLYILMSNYRRYFLNGFLTHFIIPKDSIYMPRFIIVV